MCGQRRHALACASAVHQTHQLALSLPARTFVPSSEQLDHLLRRLPINITDSRCLAYRSGEEEVEERKDDEPQSRRKASRLHGERQTASPPSKFFS